MIAALTARETHKVPTEDLGSRTLRETSRPEKVTA